MLMPTAIRVLVSHPDPLLHRGILFTLDEDSRFVVMAQSPDTVDVSQFEVMPVSVFITDLTLGIHAALHLRESGAVRHGTMPEVLVLTNLDGELSIRRALERGVKGYLTQDCQSEQLIDAVLALARGQRYLQSNVVQRLADTVAQDIPTPREIDVLRLMATGLCNKAIALELHIGCGTVKTHVKALLGKLGAPTRTAAADIAKRRGLLDPSIDDLALRANAWRVGARFTRIHTFHP